MAGKSDRKSFLLTASSGRLMASLSLPAIVGMVVIGLYTFVDAIYAGQLISTSAMGAVSIAYPFTFINSGIACLIGMGSASVLSRAIGSGDQNTVDGIMGNLIAMNLILSVGEGGKAAVLTMARPLVLFVPMVLLMPMIADSGIQGVWLACVLTDLLVLLVATAMVLTSVRSMSKKAYEN